MRLGAEGEPAGRDNPPAFERNPAADRVPMLGPDDLVRLAYDDDLDTDRRKRLMRAGAALAALEAAGAVVIEHDGAGLRIIEPIDRSSATAATVCSEHSCRTRHAAAHVYPHIHSL